MNALKKVGGTVHDRVYFQLKSMIARGELPPGAALSLRPLANKLRVSKMPVVEAIRRLERDGLITVIPRLGASVKEWTHEEVMEAYHVRRALEGEAARLFVTRASPEDKKKLIQLNTLFDKFAASESPACSETDIKLHLHIVRSARYPRLYELVKNSEVETTLQYGVHMTPAEIASSYKASVGIHRALIEALLGDNPDTAEREMKRNIDKLLEAIEKAEEKKEEAELLAARR